MLQNFGIGFLVTCQPDRENVRTSTLYKIEAMTRKNQKALWAKYSDISAYRLSRFVKVYCLHQKPPPQQTALSPLLHKHIHYDISCIYGVTEDP